VIYLPPLLRRAGLAEMRELEDAVWLAVADVGPDAPQVVRDWVATRRSLWGVHNGGVRQLAANRFGDLLEIAAAWERSGQGAIALQIRQVHAMAVSADFVDGEARANWLAGREVFADIEDPVWDALDALDGWHAERLVAHAEVFADWLV
jgi:hypothetical protein